MQVVSSDNFDHILFFVGRGRVKAGTRELGETLFLYGVEITFVSEF